jgi:hypothetical protein
MPSGSAYELAILLSLKDAASGGLDRFEDRLRATGKEGRAMLLTVQDLRKDLKQGLTFAGVGVGMMAMLRNGVQAAGNFEAGLLDLKSAYQEASGAGSKSLAEQANQLNQLEHLATRLGNNLQGSTADYIGILASLKKAGVDAETVLNGAGEAAANLANVSGALTSGMANEQAKGLGQFGKLFKLQPEEFGKSVDLFSALKDRFDIDSNELIESAKYFQNTANSLKLTGFGGASETSKFFALLKREGAMEGSQAGTSATSYFQQFIAQADKRAKIKKETGLDLQLFDKKGEFLGLDNAFKEMEKFRKFSSEKRLELLNKLFGEQGGKVAGVMVQSGAEGWRSITTEGAKAVRVNEKINQQMELYNSKLEAVQGTLDNLKSSTFTPMLDTVKPVLDTTNSWLGTLQGIAKEHQGVAKVGTELFALGSIAATLAGTVKAGAAAWSLWRIAAAAANEKGEELGKTVGFLSRISALKLTIGIAAVGAGVEIISWLIEENKKRNAEEAKREEALGTGYEENFKGGALWTRRNEAQKNRENLDVLATQAFGVIQMMPSFQRGIQPENTQGGKFSIYEAASEIKQSSVGTVLSDPNVLTRLLRQVDTGKTGLNIEQSQRFKEILSLALPEKSKVASQNASDELRQEMSELGKSTGDATKNFTELLIPTEKLPFAFSRAEQSATSFADRLSNLQPIMPSIPLGSPNFPFEPGGNSPQPRFPTPGVNRPLFTPPALPPFRLQGRNTTGGDTHHINVNYSPKIEITGGDPNEFAALLYKHGEELENIISRRIDRRNARGTQG